MFLGEQNGPRIGQWAEDKGDLYLVTGVSFSVKALLELIEDLECINKDL